MTKRVLVTGGGKRVGRVILETCARAGWQPIVHYGTSAAEAEELASALGGIAIAQDLAEENAAQKLFTKIKEAGGGQVSALVNSASIFAHDTAQTMTEEHLLQNFRVNTMAPLLLAQAFAAQVEDEGVIVNMLDQKLFNLNTDHFSYTISKQALHGGTLLLARALAPKVRVVGVAPGYNLPSPGQAEDVFNRLAPTVNPLQRRLTPEDVAEAVLFALQSRAITGQVLLADNGEHLQPAERDIIFSE